MFLSLALHIIPVGLSLQNYKKLFMCPYLICIIFTPLFTPTMIPVTYMQANIVLQLPVGPSPALTENFT